MKGKKINDRHFIKVGGKERREAGVAESAEMERRLLMCEMKGVEVEETTRE